MSTAVTVCSPQTAYGGASERSRNRFPRMDSARVLAAYGIIWIHTPRSELMAGTTAVARFAVPFFVGAAVFLIVSSLYKRPDQDLKGYVVSRCQRLYCPFVVWTCVYLVFKLVKLWLTPGQPNDFPGWEVAIVGSAYHLWFLPFLLCVSVAVFSSARFIHSKRFEIPMALLFTAIGLAAAVINYPGSQTVPWDGVQFMWMALPSVFWSYAIALIYFKGYDWVATSRVSPAFVVVVAICTAGLFWLGRHSLLENIAGVSFLLLTLSATSSTTSDRIGQLAPLVFGVYLSHLLFIKVLESITTKFAIEPSVSVDLAIFSATALGSTLLVWGLHQYPRTRWLLG